MRNFSQLPPQGRVDFFVLMPVQIRPDRRIRIEIFPATRVAQHRALTRANDNRLVPEPVPHLREGGPDKFLVELGDVIFHWHEPAARRESGLIFEFHRPNGPRSKSNATGPAPARRWDNEWPE